jgi:hypothetical protein
VVLALPQALSGCAQASQVQARLWISGLDAPCFLAVDVDAGTTSGECKTPPGLKRHVTLDWFVDVGGREIVLAQASDDVDLTQAAAAEVSLSFDDGDVTTTACRDMSVDKLRGSETVDVDGVARPVCDLDDDGVANLDEFCAGGDPLGGA